jgi:hypothetical protein
MKTKRATLGCTREAARDLEKPSKESTEKPPRNSTRRRDPSPWRRLSDLQRHELLSVYLDTRKVRP